MPETVKNQHLSLASESSAAIREARAGRKVRGPGRSLARRAVSYAVTVPLLMVALLGLTSSGAGAPSPEEPPVRHVFVIVLENASYAETYGPVSKHPFLGRVLRGQGVLLDQYYATAHYSMGNYLAILGGVAPNADIQMDCPRYQDMMDPAPAPYGQVRAAGGCVFPASVLTLAGQLETRNLTWKGYMEDMGNVAGREEQTCGKPALGPGSADLTQNAVVGDAYAARHNPFLYFASIAGTPACARNVVPLTRLPRDLRAVETTPNFSFISPSLCNDGHDQSCAGQPAGAAAEDAWLRSWVGLITSSPAYRQDGALVIVNDEAGGDTRACCKEPAGPNVGSPGLPRSAAKDGTFAAGPGAGEGGGRIGALVLSPFVRPGTTSTTAYNHYSLLKSIEDLFGLDHLGYARDRGLEGFGRDVWTADPSAIRP